MGGLARKNRLFEFVEICEFRIPEINVDSSDFVVANPTFAFDPVPGVQYEVEIPSNDGMGKGSDVFLDQRKDLFAPPS